MVAQDSKSECIHPGVLLSLEDAREVVGKYIHHYNNVRLNSAICYIAPIAKLEGREKQIFKDRYAIFQACEVFILCGRNVVSPNGVPERITREDILRKYGALIE